MNKIPTIIIDDEQTALENLELLINNYCPDIEILGSATTIQKAIEIINKRKPELVFLDISMPPEGNSFELLNLIPNRTFQVIFVTAHAEHTMTALKHHAFDYILKPIDYRILVRAVQEFKQKNNRNTSSINGLKYSIIALPTESCTHLVRDIEIKYCVANGSYTNFVFSDGTTITISKSLKHVESLLNDELFQRVHRSYIVNISKISKISRSDNGYLIIENEEIPLSKTFVTQLYSKISG